MYTWVSSQSPLCCWFPPAAPMFGTMQETFKNWKSLTENLVFYLCRECGAHWVGQTLTLPILFTVHEELQNVPAVPWKEVIEESSSPGKFVIQEAISKMELQPEEEKVEKFAWKWLHPRIHKKKGVTYIRRSRQSTSCCGEGWIWSIRQISQQHSPSPRHRLRNLSFSATESEENMLSHFVWAGEISWDFICGV